MTPITLPPTPLSATVEPSPRTSFRKTTPGRRPRILLVTPELGPSAVLSRHGKLAPCVKAGGLADLGALLVDSLTEAGMDVHVALPHFSSLYQPGPDGPSLRLHLCEDPEFSRRRSVYEPCPHANLRAALAFQRDVIRDVLPRVRPDIVHCHDWMTGLVPAAARAMGIPSVFTLHNLHDERCSPGHIESCGIDVARFWQHLYFYNYPGNYETSRDGNLVSLLASGILAADHMNTVSTGFLGELAAGVHPTSWTVIDAVRGKLAAGRADGIPNSLPASFAPANDPVLAENYDDAGHQAGKRANKAALQKALGLEEDADAPLLFWPSRLDPMQKGCQLLAEIFYQTLSDYWSLGLQVVFVADGAYRPVFEGIADFHNIRHRVAVRGFSEELSRQAYAASDFLLMPSSYEPCGLSQMIGLRYGCLPIVHATGGLRDTVRHLDADGGNGFVFEHHNAAGLRWAIDEAIRFHLQPESVRSARISRIMTEAAASFSPEPMTGEYSGIYQRLLAAG